MTSGWGGDDLALRVRELRAKVLELEGIAELTWREKTALEARAATAEGRIAALEAAQARLAAALAAAAASHDEVRRATLAGEAHLAAAEITGRQS